MQSPLNLGVAEVINTYVYKVGLLSPFFDFSYSTAIGLLKGFVGLAANDHRQSRRAPLDRKQSLVKDRDMASMTSYESNINNVNESAMSTAYSCWATRPSCSSSPSSFCCP